VDIVPAGALDMLGEEISRIAAKSEGKLTFGFLLGLAIALWSANAGMKAVFDALNLIYDEDEKRGLIWLNVVSLFFTICAIAGAGLAIALVVVFPVLLAAFGLTSSDQPIIGYLWDLLREAQPSPLRFVLDQQTFFCVARLPFQPYSPSAPGT
jgi:membrane protein